MKRQLLSFILVLCTVSVFSQNAEMTKQETINYIDRMLGKTVGLEYNDGSVVDRISFSAASSGRLRFSYTASGENTYAYNAFDSPSWGSFNQCRDRSYEFDPLYVKSISLKSYGHRSVRYCTISFVKKELVREKISGGPSCREGLVNEVLLFFVMVEQKDFEKLKKALEHLVALYKAEDDPFGE